MAEPLLPFEKAFDSARKNKDSFSLEKHFRRRSPSKTEPRTDSFATTRCPPILPPLKKKKHLHLEKETLALKCPGVYPICLDACILKKKRLRPASPFNDPFPAVRAARKLFCKNTNRKRRAYHPASVAR